ncbi:MAG TPA: TonB-dependent receptor [Chitinophagaceae bacterium]|jgi:TonB-linked SusC/RagA family outer membrane protein
MKDLVIQNLDRPRKLLKRALTRTIVPVLAFLVCTISLYAQNTIRVTGQVTGDNGQPVAGATIQVKGSKGAVISDDKGGFVITAPSNAVLVISAVEFSTREIALNGKATLAVTLLSSGAKQLDQVVVVGYGTQRKRDVTGSTVSVSEKALREVPTANLQGALQGKAAGVELQTTGTMPGADMQIRIRGVRSISGTNTPLFILDGIPFDGTLNDINPDDVASLDILKDASATAIYGSRGANGVVLITTKRGKPGQPKVSYSGYAGGGNVAWKYPVFNPQEYQAMRNNSTYTLGYMPLELKDIASGVSTDWQKLIYQTAHKTDNNITVSGGNTEGTTYSLGGGYYKETAVLPGEDFTRYSLRATIDTKIGKRIKIGINTLNNVGVTNGGQFVQYGVMFPILSLSPLMPHDTNGVIVTSPAGNPNDVLTYNPELLKHNNNSWVDRSTRIRTFNSLYGEYEFMPGLKYRINLGLTYSQQEDDQFKGQDTKATPSFFRPGKGNTASVNNTVAWGYTAENLLTYDKTIASKHRISFTGLYSVQESHQHNSYVSKDSIDQDFVQFYNLGQASTTPAPVVSGGEVSWALLSYMARINYVYDNRFMLTLTARNDGSSRLAEGHKWHQYPAVSAGWDITNESFMKNSRLVSFLKLRAGFGQTSNQAINPYASLGNVSNSNNLAGGSGVSQGSTGTTIRYNYGPTVVTGYNVVSLPNPNLDWEYTKTINIGLDFGILKNRITGTIEYYHQHTNKILYSVNLPATSGVAGPFTTNIGEMQNQGMEFSFSTVNVETRSGFSWTTDFNLFFNQNKLLALSSNTKQDIGQQLFVGYSMSSIYDYKKLGIWQKNEAANAAAYNSIPGQLKLQDYSGPSGKPDGIIDANDKHVIGNGDAKLQGGMTNRFAYKSFDLSIVAYARFGGLLISQIHQPTSTYLTQMSGDRNQIKVDYWTPNNPTNWYPDPANVLSPVTNAFSSMGYYDASFVKIRSINLGYTFSPLVLKKIGAQSIRVYATVDNVGYLFSPYMKQTGIAPEGTGTGDQSVSAIGNIRSGSGAGNNTITVSASTPPVRSFIMGLNLSF